MRKWIVSVGLGALFAAGAAVAATESDAPTTAVDASKGGVTFTSGDNSLTIGARVQFRSTWDDREELDADTTGTSGFGEEDGVSGSFDVPRMRVTLKGGMWKPWLKYEFQYEMSRTSGDSSSKVKDAFLEVQQNQAAMWRFGQFKAPFSLQQLTSSGRQQFVDRAITDAKFVPGRDTGVMLFGGLPAGFGYGLGAFNGSGESRVQDDGDFMWVGRAYWQPWGEYKLSEGSSEIAEGNRLHVGLAGRFGEVQKGTDAGTGVTLFEEPNDETAYALELGVKTPRFSAAGEYFMMSNARENPPPALEDVESTGFYLQAGFMAIPRTLELGVRYAAVDPDDDVDDAGLTELRLVAGWFWRGHNLKLQGDVGQVETEAGFAGLSAIARRNLPSLGTRLVSGEDLTDRQVRLQLQLAF
jgi:phosphate-selective porin OprO/OprP